jgi:hypothetical protein
LGALQAAHFPGDRGKRQAYKYPLAFEKADAILLNKVD